jgi:plasmid stabilization system protein ParE
MPFKYTLLFLEDLAEIKTYIALDSPMNAKKVHDEIKIFCEHDMPAFPHRGMVLEQDPEIREVV